MFVAVWHFETPSGSQYSVDPADDDADVIVGPGVDADRDRDRIRTGGRDLPCRPRGVRADGVVGEVAGLREPVRRRVERHLPGPALRGAGGPAHRRLGVGRGPRLAPEQRDAVEARRVAGLDRERDPLDRGRTVGRRVVADLPGGDRERRERRLRIRRRCGADRRERGRRRDRGRRGRRRREVQDRRQRGRGLQVRRRGGGFLPTHRDGQRVHGALHRQRRRRAPRPPCVPAAGSGSAARSRPRSGR